MERFHITFKFILLLNVITATLGPDRECTEWYISSAGFNCTYCPPGSYKYGDCVNDGGNSICVICDGSHHQTHCNQALSCAPCSPSCKWRYTVKVKECSMYHDIVCECEEGRYWKNETETDGVCLKHSKCPAGHGRVTSGNAWNDTKCSACIDGKTFSPETSLEPCKSCTVCNSYTRQCTKTADVICNSNTSTGIPPTEDNTELTSSKDGGSSKLMIVSIVLGSICFILLVIIAFLCRRRRRCPTTRDIAVGDDQRDDTQPQLPDVHGTSEVTIPLDNMNSRPAIPSHSGDAGNYQNGTLNGFANHEETHHNSAIPKIACDTASNQYGTAEGFVNRDNETGMDTTSIPKNNDELGNEDTTSYQDTPSSSTPDFNNLVAQETGEVDMSSVDKESSTNTAEVDTVPTETTHHNSAIPKNACDTATYQYGTAKGFVNRDNETDMDTTSIPKNNDELGNEDTTSYQDTPSLSTPDFNLVAQETGEVDMSSVDKNSSTNTADKSTRMYAMETGECDKFTLEKQMQELKVSVTGNCTEISESYTDGSSDAATSSRRTVSYV